LDAVRAIDTTANPAVQRQLMDYFREEYEKMHVGVIVGLFSHCYLGHPYVDHRLDIDGHILEHFTAADHVPDVFSPARPLARTEAYLYIEIYQDGQIMPIRQDGTAAS